MQRLIVAQIKQAEGPAIYPSNVGYDSARWFDWGPYLWADGEQPRTFDGLHWCDAQNDGICGRDHDFRYGDPNDATCWGDFTHRSADRWRQAVSLHSQVSQKRRDPGAPGGAEVPGNWGGITRAMQM